jgi:GMP synthase (glutamine-hydrolysing)
LAAALAAVSCCPPASCASVLAQGAVVGIENPERRIFGLQYHPEVMHTEQGTDTIRHFLLDIAGLKADWTMAEVLETQIKLIEQQV